MPLWISQTQSLIGSGDYNVVGIADAVFQSKSLTEATIGDNVADIGDDAFRDNQLISLTLGSSVQENGSGAFRGSELETLVLPDSVRRVRAWAFMDNNLDDLDLGQGARSFGSSAFSNNNLTSLDLPDSVEHIGFWAFSGSPLVTVEIPAAITEVGHGAFNENPGLKSIVFNGPTPVVEPASGGGDPSFDPSSGALVLSFPWRFGDLQTSGGYDAPVWQGYATKVVATVDFDLNGQGSSAPADQDVVVGELATEPTDPNASGYVFTGWFTDATLTDLFDFSTPVDGDLTLYASWQEEQEEPEDYLSFSKTVDASYVRVFDWELAKTGQVGGVTVDGDAASADVNDTVTETCGAPGMRTTCSEATSQ